MGGVILGMPGPWADDNREKADHYTTKIGGIPDWPVEDLGIRPELLQCSLCAGKLCLLAQVYAPIYLENVSFEERVIYILGCTMQHCVSNPQSLKALRLQKCTSDAEIVSADPVQLEEQSVRVKEMGSTSKLPSTSYSAEYDEYDYDEEEYEEEDDIDLDDLAQALAEATTLASQSKRQNEPKRAPRNSSKDQVVEQRLHDSSLPVLPCFYIYCETEQDGKSCASSGGDHPFSMKEIQDTSGDPEEKWEGESYEHDTALGADRTYLKFKKRLDAYPEQCFRYSYGGRPLLVTTSLPEAGTCKLCGSLRQFEVQLMPPLLYFLSEGSDSSSGCSPDGWTWMTFAVYTCSKSCCPSFCGEKSVSCCWGVAEEEVIIQSE